jgi:phage terminase large subunit
LINPTTALRKIAAMTKRIKVIQGGQGAGKTFSILMLIINHASSNEGLDIYIASAELSKMRITVIKDFVKIMRLFGIFDRNSWKGGKEYEFRNKSKITFIGLDKEDIGKGLRSDLIFLNEANKTSFETYRELTSRAKQVILDYNPNSEFWVHTEILDRDDSEFLILTYTDNEYLADTEIKEIEINRSKAYINLELPNLDIVNNVKSKYYQNKWQIYGLGKIGSNPNRIFFWNSCTVEAYQNFEAPVYYGVDWGTVDPLAMIEAKYTDGRLFIRELNYKSENQIRESLSTAMNKKLQDQDEGLIKWLFAQKDINRDRPIICDNNRVEKIKALRSMGFDYAIRATKTKGSILDGIDILNGLEVYYTQDSKNIDNEQKNYSRVIDRYGVVLEEPEDKNNHLMDAVRYIVLFLRKEGIIKNI